MNFELIEELARYRIFAILALGDSRSHLLSSWWHNAANNRSRISCSQWLRPIEEWLDDLEKRKPRAYAKCVQRIVLLSNLGSELRRPVADMLRDGIRELRAKVGTVNYRILYFFCGANLVCLSHGITKAGEVPDSAIEVALKRKKLVEGDQDCYTADWEE